MLAWKKEVTSQYGTTREQIVEAAKIKKRPGDISDQQYNLQLSEELARQLQEEENNGNQ